MSSNERPADAQESPINSGIQSADIAQHKDQSISTCGILPRGAGDASAESAATPAPQPNVTVDQPIDPAAPQSAADRGEVVPNAEPSSTKPGDLIDVPIARPISRGAAMILLTNLLYYAIWTAIVIVAVIQGFSGPWLLGIWIGGMILWVTIIELLKLRRARIRTTRFVEQNTRYLIEGEYRYVVGKLAEIRGFARTETLASIAATIRAMGATGLTIRMGQPNRLSAIRPLGVPFEPRPLDGLVDWTIEGAELPQAIGGAARVGGGATIRAKGGLVTRFLQSAWASVTILLVFWIPGAISAYRTGRPRSSFLIVSVFLLLSLRQALRTRAQVQGSTWRQGFIVPGGLVFRKSTGSQSRDPEGKYVAGNWTLHLFDRRKCVLFIYQRTIDRWVVQASDSQTSATVEMNRVECDRLLAAWLSPLSPPPVERLSDLA